MDLLLGGFADAYIADLADDDLACFEALMDVPDPDLFAWITGEEPVAAPHGTRLYAAIVAFHTAPKSDRP